MAVSETGESLPRARPLRLLAKCLMIAAVALALVAMTAWGALFLRFSNVPSEPVRLAMAGLFVASTAGSFALLRRRRRTLAVYLGVFAVLLVWYFAIPPSNDRVWSPEVAVLPVAVVDGETVEIRNIRDFEYRSLTDFTPRYYDKTFDLSRLESVDLICVHWGNPAIAHVMASFGFGGGEFVAFSIEMRKEQGEAGSMLRSFFRKYELIYIAADERDVIRLRTGFREPREDVYIYRTRLPVVNQRKLFLSYIDKINELTHTPEWYNTLEDNCTTGVLQRTKAYRARGRYNWKVLFSGYVPSYAYELGMIDTGMPFEELRERCHINARAGAAPDDAGFSRYIREGVPAPPPYSMAEFESGR